MIQDVIIIGTFTGGIEDFNAIKSHLGNISDLESLIKVANENGQQIFLELDPNHSSVEHPWFKRSVEKQEPFSSYYVWTDGISRSEGRKERPSPPNNWVSYTFFYIKSYTLKRKYK